MSYFQTYKFYLSVGNFKIQEEVNRHKKLIGRNKEEVRLLSSTTTKWKIPGNKWSNYGKLINKFKGN